MEQLILIAEPCELLLRELRMTFLQDTRVSRLYETTTSDGLKTLLRRLSPDLVIVNQALIQDVSILPRKKFVILASELDMRMLKVAYLHGMRGYLSVGTSIKLLETTLDYTDEALLLEPSLTPKIMNSLFSNIFPSINEELLTPREREIVHLLREGLDRRTIAKRLCIAETTLKTHIKNIRKREIVLNDNKK